MRRCFEKILTAPPSWLRPVLVPLAFLYSGTAALHRGLYRLGILKSVNLPRPVVSVGNLTAGGGGKTPIVMWLAEKLIASGVRVAVLTRGYGRVHDGLRIVEPEDGWEIVGDEPALMVSKIKGVTVAVSNDRFAAGTRVLENGEVDLFLLDDGFQHYALKRDLNIVVVDGHRRFGNGRLMPAGILREPVSRLQNADLIVVTKARREDPEFKRYLSEHSTAPVFWADYRPEGLSPVISCEGVSKEEVPEGTFVAFCGIAGPEGFHDTLARAGIEVAELLVFPDHHPFSASDVDRIVKTAERRQAVGLVTTEKDAIRWPRGNLSLPVYSLSIQPVIEGEEDILERILTLVRKARGTA